MTSLPPDRDGPPAGPLTPWQVVQLARHPQRPRLVDYLAGLFTDVMELHGDRLYRDDPALLAALARFDGEPVVVVGHNKGKDTRENVARNFGMPYPEGYRKALRAMRLAEKFRYPVLSFVDTPGAYPGDEAEERGQAEAIARNIQEMSRLRTPILVVITGEGGSGGALAIGVGDVILMLQHAVYTVISPEGCAAILWHDASRAEDAAAALRLTATDLLALGVVDEVVPEPPGGAHADPDAAVVAVRDALGRHLPALRQTPVEVLLERRYAKYRRMGRVVEVAP
ncbi:MAG: acetyl-CoA carboxylase carboxyltransferase subunit alpha [Armatimonadota bacterium]|nr:acetyl-CoA carboxylase carboxyltransferase subunit alpha [Armatimonadota bacterium]MDR7438101.1 acetyl-CoA carboxylase carboxyltransferase subunit alpha [Armatimonadota bacterium]MDR7471533.1 acetyl-CoA carboxylase carboxyltransferase subunit alpha [Armatimonadota bacterium]MDR7507799.1 acetyl-CoA carboxylase carboxyltransferase subunit alpha [Armatimonadota bacterium]MDR7509591.1 acetyl-CoA carboxylase carboxyltransferase subunit alpha [Armatimonadota bacterium]